MGRDATQEIRFQGIAYFGSQQGIPAIANIKYHTYDPTSLDINVSLLERDAASGFSLDIGNIEEVIIKSNLDPNVVLQIADINGYTISGSQLELKASRIELNFWEQIFAGPAKYMFSVEFIPTGILYVPAIVELNADGSVKHKKGDFKDIIISTGYGDLIVGGSYGFFDAEYYDSKGLVSIRRVTCSGTLEVKDPHSIVNIHHDLLTLLNDVSILLSFCCRVPVTYYQVKYFQVEPRSHPCHNESIFRRVLWNPPKKARDNALIDVRNLSGDGLETLLRYFRKSPIKTDIERVIQFLSASYRSTSIETSFFLCFSLIDSLTSNIAKGTDFSNVLRSSTWKSLEDAIRKTIDDTLLGVVDSSIIALVKDKLPELKRAPVGSRICSVCKHIGVRTNDLWLKVPFELGIEQACAIRNTLFHGAACSDYGEMFKTTVRLRILAERIILKFLDWPEDRLFKWHEEPLHHLIDR